MINNQDRSGWIGASDTHFVMGNWDSKTFALWWLEKLGLRRNTIKTLPMQTGSAFEHRILDAMGVKKRDRQIKIRYYRLRVNLDGEDAIVHEVKTYGADQFKVTRNYWMQAQVESFAARKPVVIDAYRLEPDDYTNWYRTIDPDRLSHHPVEYDLLWIQNEYLLRLKYLSKCLKKGAWPDANQFKRGAA